MGPTGRPGGKLDLVGETIENLVGRLNELEGALSAEHLRHRRLDGEYRRSGNDEAGESGDQQFFVVPGHLKSPKGLNSMGRF